MRLFLIYLFLIQVIETSNHNNGYDDDKDVIQRPKNIKRNIITSDDDDDEGDSKKLKSCEQCHFCGQEQKNRNKYRHQYKCSKNPTTDKYIRKISYLIH